MHFPKNEENEEQKAKQAVSTSLNVDIITSEFFRVVAQSRVNEDVTEINTVLSQSTPTPVHHK